MMKYLIAVLWMTFGPQPTQALEWAASTSFLFAKEQARSGSGASNGPLFEDRQLAIWLHLYHPLNEDFYVGPFLHYENGARQMCGFSLDGSGIPTPAGCHSGTSNQIWFGPAMQYRFGAFFIEAQYIVFGRRTDSAYSNLSAGDDTTFSTHPFKAWVLTPGASIALSERLKLNLKIEYRFLYYSGRGGEDLPGDQLYGNQAIRPQIGITGSL